MMKFCEIFAEFVFVCLGGSVRGGERERAVNDFAISVAVDVRLDSPGTERGREGEHD